MTKLRKQHRGLSIVEVLLSFTILAVAILALLGIIPAAGRQGAATNIQNQALFIAQHRMDTILRNGAFLPGSVTPTNPLPDRPQLQMQITYGGEPMPGGIGQGQMQKVTVQVSWVEAGRARSVELVSAVAQQ